MVTFDTDLAKVRSEASSRPHPADVVDAHKADCLAEHRRDMVACLALLACT